MMRKVANREALDGVQQMHRTVHAALEALLNRNAPDEAAELLRALDVAMVDWINETRNMR